MALRSRPYAALDDLREMQSIVTAAWRSERRPLVPCTVGDLEWWLAGAGPDVDLSSRIRIWGDGDESLGWGWFRPPASLDWFVRPDLRQTLEWSIRDEMIGWLGEQARGSEQPGVADGGGGRTPEPLSAWAADGWPEATFLVDRGFAVGTTALTQFLQSLDRPLPEPELPPGYSVRALGGPADFAARVAVHRAAFAPSRMTVEKYEILASLDHYACDRDLVVVAPDGTFAAFTMCWLDLEAAVGEFEPVGTHPDHRRRGLGRAINIAGLRRLQELGARDAIVFSDRSNAASEGLYRSVGFAEIAVHRLYTRPGAATAATEPGLQASLLGSDGGLIVFVEDPGRPFTAAATLPPDGPVPPSG